MDFSLINQEVMKMNLRDIVNLVNKEKRKIERTKTVKHAVVSTAGIVAVAAAGVTIGMLIAPKSGEQTRKDIKKKVTIVLGAIKDKLPKKDANSAGHAKNNSEKEI